MKWLAVLILADALSGCAGPPIQGGFQPVCDKLVAMGPATRAIQMGANGPYYEKTYGIHYDPVTDALYTLRADGTREFILKGDLVRATFLIDSRK